MAAAPSAEPPPPSWRSRLAASLDDVVRAQVAAVDGVVDYEIVPPRDATLQPDDFTVWLVCRTPEERHRFADLGRSRFIAALNRALLARGFPESALTSLTLRLTSRTELAARGGRF